MHLRCGHPENTSTIYDIAVRVREMTGSPSEIVFTDARAIHRPGDEEGESFERPTEISISRAPGWSAWIGREELLEEAIRYDRVNEDALAAYAALRSPAVLTAHAVAHFPRRKAAA
jgi:hypothetical protein